MGKRLPREDTIIDNLRINIRCSRRAITILNPPIQIHRLDHGTELGNLDIRPIAVGLQDLGRHRLPGATGVLDVEDGLAGRDKGLEVRALLLGDALLVHRELHDGEDVLDDGAGVLEAYGEVVGRCFGGEEADEGDGIGFFQVEAVIIVLGECQSDVRTRRRKGELT